MRKKRSIFSLGPPNKHGMGKLGHCSILCIFISGMPHRQKFTKIKKNPKDALVSLRPVVSTEPSLLFLDQPDLRVRI